MFFLLSFSHFIRLLSFRFLRKTILKLKILNPRVRRELLIQSLENGGILQPSLSDGVSWIGQFFVGKCGEKHVVA